MSHRARVLFVDDDQFDNHTYKWVAQKVAIEPVMTGCIIKALCLLEQLQGQIDAAFLDYRLHTGTSTEIIRSIRSRTSTALMPVIVVTQDRSPELYASLRKLGVDSIIHKDMNPMRFREKIEQAVLYWTRTNTLYRLQSGVTCL